MKRFLLFIALVSVAHAAGSVQQNIQNIGGNVFAFSFNWTGDAANGSVPATVAQGSLQLQGYRVISMETTPGSPAPTNAYSITLIDNAGVDIMAGASVSLSNTSGQSFAGSPTAPPLYGSFTFTVTGNSVAGAKGSAVVYLAPLSQVLGLSPTSPSFPAQGANLVYASPCGSSGSPGFRALCATDLTLAGLLGSANTWTANNTFTGATVDLHNSTKTLPNRSGTGSPNGRDNCATIGETYFQTDATPGTNIWGCTVVGSPGTWAVESIILPAGTQTQYLRLQPNTGNNTTLQFNGFPITYVADYNFPSQTPGGSLSIGSNTITLAPCPLGLNGVDPNHFVYISGGTGTAEAVLITGGTCTSQANSGTIIFTAANTHTGAWTVTSATNGAREAVISLGNSGGMLFFAAQTWTMRAQLVVDQPNIRFMGSRGAIIQAAANALLQNVVQSTNAATNFIIDGLTLDGNRANSGTTQNPGAAGNARNLYAVVLVGSAHSEILNSEIRLGQVNAIYLGDTSIAASDFKLTNNYIHDCGGTINSSGFGTGIYLNGNSGTTISGVHIVGNHFENIFNTVTGPGQSGAINGALTNDVVVTGNYIKNNYNVLGGQLGTGSTTGPSCGSNDTNWTVTGNTFIQTAHFGGDFTEGVEVCGQFHTVTGNTFFGNGVGGVVIDGGSSDVTVSGNYINSNGNQSAGTTEGINISGNASAITLRVTVTGNFATGYTYGVTTGFASNNFINISGNQFSGSTAPLQDLSTAANVNISMNMGALAFGVSTFNIGVGASPFTFTNGHFPESVAIFGGTVSSVAVAGTNFCTSTPCFLHLNPEEALTITYTVLPTMNIINE